MAIDVSPEVNSLYGGPVRPPPKMLALGAEGEPFILLDDARSGGPRPVRLYRQPLATVTAERVEDVEPALDQLRRASRDGLYLAGFLTYEAGLAFEPRLGGCATETAGPLLWFGLFETCQSVDGADVDILLRGAGPCRPGSLRPAIDMATYARRFARVRDYIEAGDIYQANLTFQSSLPFEGDPVALYRSLRVKAGAGHGALVATGDQWLLSFSPELFFSLDNGRLLARPMKGTAARGATEDEDAELAALLAVDPKQRAENLMIVDLLRNDLSRVAIPGSVEVARLFAVERYPTIYQLVSDIGADLKAGLDAFDVLRATFPCGSITGAPKLRAMEVLASVEGTPRGIYTGSIGRIDPDGDACFNVAIRTLSIAVGSIEATLGLGSGVVADSTVGSEWRECLDKARFLGP